jgi:sulfatase maturation enzyme AslB (radical SAM superfamily)
MQRQRKSALSPKRSKSCHKCNFIKIDRNFPYEKPDPMMNAIQLENWGKARMAIKNKNTVVDAAPVRQVWYLGSKCNLSCIMCCDFHNREIQRRMNLALMGEMIEALEQANELLLIGGEPFCMTETSHILEKICARGIDNLRLSACTNATLLHNFFKTLKKFRRVHLGVSIDGIGKYYNHIRQGANWEKTQRNILKFSEIAREKDRLWDLHINAVIMKSSIQGIDKLVDWCLDHGFSCRFKPLIDQPFTRSENIWNHPELLKSISGWEQKLEYAVEKLATAGMKDESRVLNNIRQSIPAG